MQQVCTRAQPDVFIAGAGPAGLACAVFCALQGFSVHVADGMEPPIDKACGEGLMPDALAALVRMGIPASSIPGAPIRGIRFIGPGDLSVAAEFPLHSGCGIKRAVLHQLLYERAAAAGVRFSWRTAVQGVEDGVVRTSQGGIRPRYIVGADGHSSRVAHSAGLSNGVVHSRRIGLRQHYFVSPWTSHVEVYWSDYGQAYVTPVSSEEISVVFISRERFRSAEAALSNFPALRDRLAGVRASEAPRGAITLGRTLRRVATGNVALIGDASGSVDAVTGEGIALGFRHAAALAQAMRVDNLAGYQMLHRGIQRLPARMSRGLLLMDRSPYLRNRLLRTFGNNPRLFEHLLRVHVGESPVRFFGADGLFATGLHLLTT